MAQLEIIDSLDHMLVINTDKSLKWSNDGMIRFADNKDGEIIEAWRKSTYNNFAKEVKCSVLPVSSNNVFITEHEKFDVKNVITTPNNSKVLDFGQNIAGYISFKLIAKKGQKIKLRFGEMFDEKGEFTQKIFNVLIRNVL